MAAEKNGKGEKEEILGGTPQKRLNFTEEERALGRADEEKEVEEPFGRKEWESEGSEDDSDMWERGQFRIGRDIYRRVEETREDVKEIRKMKDEDMVDSQRRELGVYKALCSLARVRRIKYLQAKTRFLKRKYEEADEKLNILVKEYMKEQEEERAEMEAQGERRADEGDEERELRRERGEYDPEVERTKKARRLE